VSGFDLVDMFILINCYRARVPLPPNFDKIQLNKAQMEKLAGLGIDYWQPSIRGAQKTATRPEANEIAAGEEDDEAAT